MGKKHRRERDEKIKRHEEARKAKIEAKPTLPPPHVIAPSVRVGKAEPHGTLVNDFVHVFVDDQNLFWGIVNDGAGRSYRIDFGLLLTEVSKDTTGRPRPVKSAYIAGVIPDDDTFWAIARNQGFTVRRGYLGYGGRSKQDDAYLITDLVTTIHEEQGPSTVVLVAGDADYVPPLIKSKEKGWRNEVAFITQGASPSLVPVVHEFRLISPPTIEHVKGLTMRNI